MSIDPLSARDVYYIMRTSCIRSGGLGFDDE